MHESRKESWAVKDRSAQVLILLVLLSAMFFGYRQWASVPIGEGMVAISEGDQRRSEKFFCNARVELMQLLNDHQYVEVSQDDWKKVFQKPGDESISICVDKVRNRPKHLKAYIDCSVQPPIKKTFDTKRQECERMQKILGEWWKQKKAIDDGPKSSKSNSIAAAL